MTSKKFRESALPSHPFLSPTRLKTLLVLSLTQNRQGSDR